MTVLEARYMERAAVRVDAAKGIIFGAKLLGGSSRNGRKYSERAMREAVAKYNGVKVYLDHPDRDKIDSRKFNDWLGIVENASFRNGGIYGNIVLRTKSPHYDSVIEAAEKFSTCFGLSHVADGSSRIEGDTEIIESISDVFSVDIVTDPATCAGLFESVGSLDSVRHKPTKESFRRAFAPILPRSYSRDELATFAHRLR